MHAFRYCWKLEYVYLPEGLECLWEGAFFDSGLKEVLVPNSVTQIDSIVFGECSFLSQLLGN